MTIHYHVAHGIAGYGPDGDDIPTFETLSEALDYAREELGTDVDMADDDARACANAEDYESAWKAHELAERLALLRANLDPKRKDAPMYANDPQAYALLQETQAAEFPIDVGNHSRLYLWDCSETECLQEFEAMQA